MSKSSLVLGGNNGSARAVKKIIIKNLKEKPKLPENYEEDTWAQLCGAIRAIHHKQPIEQSLEELYRACENLCFHNLQQMVYDRLQAECESHTISQLNALLGKTSQGLGIFLDAANQCWQDHTSQLIMIRSIFLYLDRTYVLQTPGLPAIWDMGLALFRKHIASHPEIKAKLIEGLLILINSERKGEDSSRSLVKNLIRMFLDLQIYPEFEKPFLSQTQTFYQQEGVRLIHELEAPFFLEHVEKRLKEELDRINTYLDSSTRKPLITQVETHLLAPHVSTILDKGFEAMADDNRHADLARLYSLLSRIDMLNSLKATFGVYIRHRGSEIVSGGEERDKTMVQELINFKTKTEQIVAKGFFNNTQFGYCEKESFENFVNIRQNKPAELIAKFIDEKLKAGNKGTTDEELENDLDKCLVLFKFIQGKDVFEAFYKKDLAKRLLLAKSASVDAEKLMLSKFKTECGSGFTANLEGMFKDIDLSRDVMSAFNNNQRIKSMLKGFELYVNILTASYWPTYQPDQVILLAEMATYQEIFKNFYLTQHSGKKLLWQNSLGVCVLKANFPSGKKELSVSLYQALVLFLFNDTSREHISYQEIKTQTQIEEEELKRVLQSLACGKVRILNKNPKGKDINPDDTFSFNAGLKHPLTRIKVNAIQLKETAEEQKDTQERVFLDRQYQIDAAVVRIMKTRKKLSHNILISELYNQLKFPVSPADLKKRIESLIDREYLERDKNSSSEYHYLA